MKVYISFRVLEEQTKITPEPPDVFFVHNNHTIQDVTKTSSFSIARGRGRAAISLELNMNPVRLQTQAFVYSDVILTYARAKNNERANDAFFGSKRPLLALRKMKGFETRNTYALATEIDNDGHMEIISWPEIAVHKLKRSFVLEDISERVLPMRLDRCGVLGIAEFNFDTMEI